MISLGSGFGGAAMLAFGTVFMPGTVTVLEAFAIKTSSLDIIGTVVSRKCFAKTTKC